MAGDPARRQAVGIDGGQGEADAAVDAAGARCSGGTAAKSWSSTVIPWLATSWSEIAPWAQLVSWMMWTTTGIV